MTIALVIPALPGYSETFLNNKIKGLRDSGFKVILMVVGESVKRKMDIPVYYQPILAKSGSQRFILSFWLIVKSLFTSPLRCKKLIREAKKAGYSGFGPWRMLAVLSNFLKIKTDWIHFAYATMAIERAFIGRVLNAKVGLSLRGYDISIFPVLNPGIYTSVWPYVDKVHSISTDLISAAKKQGMPDNMAFTLIHPAIDTSAIHKQPRVFNTDKLKFLSVGRLHWKKGFEYTLEALAHLTIGFEYTIIGDGPERERLIFAAYQLGILDKVNFVGKKSHEEVLSAMQQNDIYLQYSIQEGFCNAVLEAQASGMLCIVSDAEGLAENVLNSETGWVVEKRKPLELIKHFKKLANLTAVDKSFVSKKATDRIENGLTIKAQNLQFKKFFTDVHSFVQNSNN